MYILSTHMIIQCNFVTNKNHKYCSYITYRYQNMKIIVVIIPAIKSYYFMQNITTKGSTYATVLKENATSQLEVSKTKEKYSHPISKKLSSITPKEVCGLNIEDS